MATAGPNNPGTTASDSGVGTVAWTNPGNVASSNNSYATATLTSGSVSHYLKVTNFGFSIPAGATINGITVEIERNVQNHALADPVQDNRVRLVKAGTIQTTDKASVSNWPASDTYATYGGGADLWSGTWTDSDINDSGFGMAISAKGVSVLNDPPVAQIDHIRITITYTEAAGGQPFAMRDERTVPALSGINVFMR